MVFSFARSWRLFKKTSTASLKYRVSNKVREYFLALAFTWKELTGMLILVKNTRIIMEYVFQIDLLFFTSCVIFKWSKFRDVLRCKCFHLNWKNVCLQKEKFFANQIDIFLFTFKFEGTTTLHPIEFEKKLLGKFWVGMDGMSQDC